MLRLIIFLLFIFSTSAYAGGETDKYAAVQAKLQTCVVCHGDKGTSQIPQNPILAGQHLYYIYLQLRDFKNGTRENLIMQPLAQTLENEEMLLIAEYFSEQTWPEKNNFTAATAKEITLGKSVVTQGQCVQCHLGGFEGASGVPRVAGQYPIYIEKTLLDFKNKIRNNSPAKNSLLVTFSDEEIKAVSAYITNIKP